MRTLSIALLLITLVGVGVGCAPPLRVPPAGEPPPPSSSTSSPTSHWEEIAVNGSLEEVDGVCLLRLWGTRQEMGYAYGFLMANELADAFEQYLFGVVIERLPAEWTYAQLVESMTQHILWPEGYQEEMEAVIQGMETRLGRLPEITHPRVEGRGAPMDATMLALLNALLDERNGSAGCGFAAWGTDTADGRVRVGGSLVSAHRETVLVVRRPRDGISTVCLNPVGALTCSHGMNELGVTVVSQTAGTTWFDADTPCYADVHARLALEGEAGGPDFAPRLAALFDAYPHCGSSTLLFAQRSDHEPEPVAVVVQPAGEDQDGGLTLRQPSHHEPHTVATNPSLSREEAAEQRRAAAAALQQHPPADPADVGAVLAACASQETDQPFIGVEPDSLTIHVAFHTSSTPVTWTWEELFAPLESSNGAVAVEGQ